MKKWSKGGSDCHCRAFGTHHSDRDLGITEIQVVTPLFSHNLHIHPHQAFVDHCVDSPPKEHRLRTVRFLVIDIVESCCVPFPNHVTWHLPKTRRILAVAINNLPTLTFPAGPPHSPNSWQFFISLFGIAMLNPT